MKSPEHQWWTSNERERLHRRLRLMANVRIVSCLAVVGLVLGAMWVVIGR